MFKRFVKKARQTVHFSKNTADQFGCRKIETEHVLLALLEDADLNDRLLRGVSVETLREEIAARAARLPVWLEPHDLPLSKDSRQALAFAVEEADRLGNRDVGNQHILLGLLRVENCIAAQVLQQKGLSADIVRSRISPGAANVG